MTCYFPDGSVIPSSSTVTPCDESADFSACCPSTAVCVSNGYCFQQATAPGTYNNRFARWGCTDPDWGNACPQYCKDGTIPQASAIAPTLGATLREKSNVGVTVLDSQSLSVLLMQDTAAGGFCCSTTASLPWNTEANQCLEQTLGTHNPFTLPEGQFIYDRTTGATLVNGSFDTASTTAAASGQSTTGAVSQSSCATDTPAASNVVPVAAGLGVSLGLLFLISLAVAVVFLRQNRALKKQLREREAASPKLDKFLEPQYRNHTGSGELDAYRRPEIHGQAISEVSAEAYR